MIRSVNDRSWVAILEDAVVEQVIIDWAVTFVIGLDDKATTIRIESPFVVAHDEAETLVLPEEPQSAVPVLSLVRRQVRSMEAFDGGALEVVLDDGWLVAVPATEDYEPWGLTRGDGLRIVSVPGGELAVWLPSEQP
jgi:hypothetical protein